MIAEITLGAIFITLTVIFHAFSLDWLLKRIKWVENIDFLTKHRIWKASLLTGIIVVVTGILFVEMWAWAFLYYFLQALPDLEASLYYSVSSFTTVGYGDVVPHVDWQLLGAFESVNGFIVFGWSTAFIFEIISKLYKKEVKSI